VSCNNNCNNNFSRKKQFLLFVLKDATVVVQNAVASASVASSPASVFVIAPVRALNSSDFVAADLKTNPFNLILSLKNNTQPQIPVAVSSLSSSSSSKAPLQLWIC
jgi:hypothetical protein